MDFYRNSGVIEKLPTEWFFDREDDDAASIASSRAEANDDKYPIDVEQAKADFNALARSLSSASSMHRVKTGEKTLEDADEDDFDLRDYLRSSSAANDNAGLKHKYIGVHFQDLSVIGGGGIKLHVRRFPDAIKEAALTPVSLALKFLPKRFNPFTLTPKPILSNFTGLAKPGEMVLVLGRPGSGCSTFLKTVAGRRGEYLDITGDVNYSGMEAKEFLKTYNGETLYNSEADQHYPTLTVGQTLRFALSTKTPGTRLPNMSKNDFIEQVEDLLLRMLNITHTKNTLIGNEYIRGVSGGERRRVSIAEMMATGACVASYDNSTRGLDASTALDYAKALRVMTDVFKMTTFVSLYQAGEGIYEQFDKVLVIDEGKQVYFGPASEARQYFIGMGFEDYPRQTTADYLTGCTDPNERTYQRGRDERNTPSTSDAQAAYYQQSHIYRDVLAEIDAYKGELKISNPIAEFKEAVLEAKRPGSRKKSSYQISFLSQVATIAHRQFLLKGQDLFTLFTSYITAIGVGLIIGSLFLSIPKTSAGAFTRGGALFISLLFNSFNAFAELPTQVMGRPVLQKQVGYRMFRPSAYALGTLIADFPFGAILILIFSMIVYLMCDLVRDAAHFFTFYLIILMTFYALTAFFRTCATVTHDFNVAARLAAGVITIFVVYSGYIIPVYAMKRWLFWIYYINPVNYGFSALMMNEFKDLSLRCAGFNIVPSGPGYNTDGLGENQICTLMGARPGQEFVSGRDYIEAAYQMNPDHLWRNFGLIIVFFIAFQALNMYAIEATQNTTFPSIVIFERENEERKVLNERLQSRKEAARRGEFDKDLANSVANKKPFTWEKLSYTVPVSGGHKKLLDDIYGYVVPGTLTALMGASGAGKTTLLDVLAMRKTIGVIGGDILVGGKPVGIDFQRGTAYCEQLDVHESTATVREALRFSAYLRQPFEVPQEEKDAYVEEIIELLELQDLADAMIGFVGLGLDVEARKRLTIGVELAAKPELLLFLDEPTSGLDGQSAFNVVRFLRKLAGAGQAILCTIHQPNAMLFEHFDRLLLLQRGGRTAYFGDIGKDAAVLRDYFGRNGAPCPEHVNPAEFMLEIIGSGSGKRIGPRDWAEVYLDSPEFEANKRKIQEIKASFAGVQDAEGVVHSEYATPWLYQLKVVTQRTLRAFWRQADYGYTRLYSHGIIALIVALTFLNLGSGVQDLQYRIFVMFFATVIPAIIIAQVEPMFIFGRMTFIREASSKMYSQPIFAIGQLISETPYSLICALVYWVLYYYPTGMSTNSERAFYAFLMIFLTEVYSVTLGQVVAAITPNIGIAAILNPFLLILFTLFCGVTIIKDQIPKFWRVWMYQLDPFTRVMGGLVVNEFQGLTVQCTPQEFSIFNPPANTTCLDYARDFVVAAGGYLANSEAMEQCMYCPYARGDEFYRNLDLDFDNRYRDLAIVFAFLIFNVGATIVASKYLRFAKR